MTPAISRLVAPLLLLLALLGAAVPATAQSGDDLFIKAFNCETDPGSIGLLSVPEECAEAAGVAFTVATEDGAEVGSCVTADFGGCVVEVPLGTTVVVTEDVSTLPTGYAPTENPRTRQTPPPPGAAGEFIAVFVNVATDTDAGATNDGGLASGGIGLTRAAWEAEHGPGASCCSVGTGEGGRTYQVLSYEGGAYYVGLSSDDNFQNEVVTFVEWSWGVGDTPTFEEFAALLPADAVLVETFGLPSTPDGPIAVTVYRFESNTLAATTGAGGGETGSIAVLYQEEPKASQGRVSITVGTPS